MTQGLLFDENSGKGTMYRTGAGAALRDTRSGMLPYTAPDTCNLVYLIELPACTESEIGGTKMREIGDWYHNFPKVGFAPQQISPKGAIFLHLRHAHPHDWQYLWQQFPDKVRASPDRFAHVLAKGRVVPAHETLPVLIEGLSRELARKDHVSPEDRVVRARRLLTEAYAFEAEKRAHRGTSR